MEQALVLILDPGGGALLHLSPDFRLCYDALNVRPFFILEHDSVAVGIGAARRE